MTRIDFYILSANTAAERTQFAVRLCDKAFKQGLQVMLIAADAPSAAELSEQLWHLKPESFLPNAAAELADADTPIVVSSGADSAVQHGLLINLGHQVPTMFSRFARLAEIVVQTPETLAATRRHFAFYKARGYPIKTHNL